MIIILMTIALMMTRKAYAQHCRQYKTTRIVTLLFIGMITSVITLAQNLIPNPSFESINYCEARLPCSPSAWFSVSNIPYGYQNNLFKSIDGKHSLAILIAVEEEIRFYWQTMLLCDLQEGQDYSISFNVYNPGTTFHPDYIGIHLSDTILHSTNDTLLRIDECKCIKEEILRPLKNGWSEVRLSFVSTGKEKYFLIGNLSKLSNKEILRTSGNKQKILQYYIDNISLISNSKSKNRCLEYKLRNDSLYAVNVRHSYFKTAVPKDSIKITKIPSSILKVDTLILGKINFNFDSDELVNTAVLKKYFDKLSFKQIKNIQVIGYTDSIGSKVYNLKLSERRASSVNNYLVNVLKISKDLIIAIGKGIINDKSNLENNRRVELIITKKD